MKQWWRRMVKYLIYYAVVILTVCLAVRFFDDHMKFTLASLVPLMTVGWSLLWAIRVRNGDNIKASINSVTFTKVGGHATFMAKHPSKFDTVWDRLFEFIYLVITPLPIPFIYFFSDNIKITVSAILFFSPLALMLLILIIFLPIQLKREREQHQKKYEQRLRDLEEQKQREEMGDWK